MTVTRIDPPLWFNTPKGEALAHFMIAETEMDIVWVCFQQGSTASGNAACEAGECWSWSNQDVRAMSNQTIGRKVEKKFKR